MIKRILLLCFLLLLTVGCSKQEMSELNIQDVDTNVKSFVVDHIGENGVYMLQRDGKDHVILINNMNVEDSLKLYTIEDVRVETVDGICSVSYAMTAVEEEGKADDFRLFEFRTGDDCDMIKLVCNGEETYFKSIVLD